MALLLVLQLLPLGTVFAAGDGTETLTNLDAASPADKYVTKSVSNVQIWSGSTQIMPVGGVYSNVPENATLSMDLRFDLSDGSGSTFYTYDGGEYFTVALPEGITFNAASGKVQASHSGSYLYDIATYVISGSAMTINLTNRSTDTTGHGGASNPDHKGKYATIHVEGNFKRLHAGDSEQTVFKIGSQTITINRVPLPTNFLIDKSFVGYDASTNELSWQVVVRPPEDYKNLPYNGLTLSDTLTGNHDFDKKSFKLNNVTIDPTFSGSNASYTFPNGSPDIIETQTLTYKTNPTAFSGNANASTTFGNTASLKNGATTLVSDSDSKSLKWITKSGAKQSGDPTVIKWTVNIDVPGDTGKAVTGAQIIDNIPADLIFIDDSSTYPVTVKYGNVTDQKVTAGYTFSSGQLTYAFPAEAQPTAGTRVSVSFYTRIDPAKLNNYLSENGGTSFTNAASFDWTENPSASNPTASSGAVSVIGAGGILTKAASPASETYAYTSGDYGTMKWVITVNKNKAALTSAVLSDAVLSGHELIIDAGHAFEVKQGSTSVFSTNSASTSVPFTFTDSSNFSYNLGDISDTYTVTFYTRVNSAGQSSLYANGTATFNNNSKLAYNGSKEATSNAGKTYNIEMLQKTAGSYDYNTKQTKWILTVNRSKLPLNGAELTDVLPAGMTIFTDPTHDFEVFINDSATAVTLSTAGITSASTSDGFKLTLPTSTSDKYKITFYTKLSDEALKTGLPWTNDKKAFRNSASLTATEIKKPVSSYADVIVNNPVIKKNGSYTSGNDIIDWTATINNNGITLANGFVTDTMSKNVQLEPDSVKLWSVDISSSTGQPPLPPTKISVSKAATERPTTGNEFTFSVVDNVLTVYLPINTDKAYILEYRTHALSGNITVSNNIVLSDATSIASNTATNVNVGTITSIGGSYSNSITVHKTDGHGNALAGAQFQLFTSGGLALKKNNANIVRTTGASGEAVFESLPSWSYIVREITPPTGYVIDTPDTEVTSLTGVQALNLTNTLGLTTVVINKTGANGVPLNDGTFSLTGKDYKNGDVNILGTHLVGTPDGIVTFSDVPIGTGQYTIKELTAPTGHLVSAEEIKVTVGYNAGKTAVQVTYPSDITIENAPVAATSTQVSFTKTDLKGTAINGIALGGTFVLKGTDYNGNPVNKSVTPAADGTVSFSDVTIGNGKYQIYETTTPSGYLNPNDSPSAKPILEVEVKYNSGHTALEVIITEPTGATNTGSYDNAARKYQNTPAVGTVSFIKSSSANPSTKINGGNFKISGTTIADILYEAYASAVNGVVTFADVPVVKDGTSYTITEVTAPPGYLPTIVKLTAKVEYSDATKTSVTVTNPATDLKNDPAPFVANTKVSVLKTDEDGMKLAGASFTLYKSDGLVLATAVSGTDGIALFTNIPTNNAYTIKETSAPTGYEISTQILSFTVSNELPLTFTVVNKKQTVKTGSISILKTDERGATLSGAEFTLYDTNGKAVQAVVTKADGTAEFNKVPEGSYTVTETRAPLGYIAAAGSTSVKVTDGSALSLTFINKKAAVSVTGSLQIVKVDKDYHPLAGAEFALYDKDGNVIATKVSGSDGMAVFVGLAPGNYSVKETEAPKGYKLLSDPLKFQINASGSALSYTLKNIAEDDDSDVAGWTDDNPSDDSGNNNSGSLPKTGGIPGTFFMLLAGLCSLLFGLIMTIPKMRQGKHLLRTKK